jgi:hypothetical protein
MFVDCAVSIRFSASTKPSPFRRRPARRDAGLRSRPSRSAQGVRPEAMWTGMKPAKRSSLSISADQDDKPLASRWRTARSWLSSRGCRSLELRSSGKAEDAEGSQTSQDVLNPNGFQQLLRTLSSFAVITSRLRLRRLWMTNITRVPVAAGGFAAFTVVP